MANPDAHVPVGTITDREGRVLHVKTDYGDVMVGCYRLSTASSIRLGLLLYRARTQARELEAARLEREAD